MRHANPSAITSPPTTPITTHSQASTSCVLKSYLSKHKRKSTVLRAHLLIFLSYLEGEAREGGAREGGAREGGASEDWKS